MAIRICTAVHRMVQAKKGSLRSVMPGARMPRMVATKLMPAVSVPTPLTISPMAQKSVAGPRLNVNAVSGA